MPYGINETMGQYSELFMLLAAGTYTVAFIAFAWDLAKSSRALRAIDLKAAQASEAGQAQDGSVYTMKITATGPNGTGVDSQVLTRGRVTGVEMYDGEPYLTVGGAILPLSSVIALEEFEPDTGGLSLPGAGTISRVASALNPLNLF